MHDDLELPDFLRIPADVRREAWKGRKLTKQGAMFRAPPSKQEEAATRQLRKELAAAEEAKKAERFARLKELAAERKALGIRKINPAKKRGLTRRRGTRRGVVAHGT